MAVALGADAVGFVFAPSSRQVTVGTARDIARRLPPEVLTVGVFRDQSPDFVVDTVLEAGLRGCAAARARDARHGRTDPVEGAGI